MIKETNGKKDKIEFDSNHNITLKLVFSNIKSDSN